MKCLPAAVTAAMLFAPQVAGASGTFVDGNKLYGFCQGTNSVASLQCTSYIFGAIDATGSMDDVLSPKRPHFCMPANATGQQVRDIVTKYLRENPSIRSERAATIVAVAIAKAFPCF